MAPLQTGRLGRARIALLASLLAVAPARATFHEMQIEQVVGGVCGDPSQQAIQLRMRLASQNQLGTNHARLIARDAAGANPVTLIVFASNPVHASAGDRILITTAELATAYGADFTFAQPIPESYFKAGKVTFEDGFGTAYWSLAWGGAAFTGSDTGSTINDPDGNFGPAFAQHLPFSSGQTLAFGGAAGDASSNNSIDYLLATSPASLTNNAGASLALPACVFGDGFVTGDLLGWSSALGGP